MLDPCGVWCSLALYEVPALNVAAPALSCQQKNGSLQAVESGEVTLQFLNILDMERFVYPILHSPVS